MKTARYSVESIAIWCPECAEAQENEDGGSQQFSESHVEQLPTAMTCQYCDAKFRKPTWPNQRESKRAA